MGDLGAGAVAWHHEHRFCDLCRKVTDHVRAVRQGGDWWVSDWSCIQEVRQVAPHAVRK